MTLYKKNILFISIIFSLIFISCSGDNINEQEIIYSANKNSNTDIYKIHLKDFEVTRLTNNKGIDTQPRWSKDKSEIAFLSERNGMWSLYIMNEDGESEKSLISELGNVENFKWCPKSKKIAAQIDDGNYTWVSVIDLENDEISHLTRKEENATLGGWSPDGEWIAFNRMTEDGSNDLYLHDINNERSQNVAPDDFNEDFISWSRESKLLFISDKDGNSEIYTFDPNNNKENRLTNNRVEDHSPVWSDNGSNILFRSMNDGDFDLYYMENTGENQKRITNTSYEIIDADW